MYTVDPHDTVVELIDQPTMDTGAPCPLVFANERNVVVSYWLADDLAEGSCRFVRFVGPRMHFFGPPNDEAVTGHPLWGRGLGFYGFYRVEQSSLVRSLERRNSVHHRHSPALFEGLNHFIITFHDSTFECVARGFEAEVEFVQESDRLQRTLEFLMRN